MNKKTKQVNFRIRWMAERLQLPTQDFQKIVLELIKYFSLPILAGDPKKRNEILASVIAQRHPEVEQLFFMTPEEKAKRKNKRIYLQKKKERKELNNLMRGVTLFKDFYKSWEWKTLRYEFLKSRQRICDCCGRSPKDGIKIHVDHIKPIRFHWHLRLKISNLQILCEDCNMGKGSHDETDWHSDEQAPKKNNQGVTTSFRLGSVPR